MEIIRQFERLNVGEHASRALRVTAEEVSAGYEARLAFLTPQGKRFVSGPLTFDGDTADYALPGALLDGPGVLLAQVIVGDGETFLRKSAVQEYPVFPSVDPEGVPLTDTGDLHDPARFYQEYLAHAHDDLYYRKAELDGKLAEKADKSTVLETGTDREAYLDDTQRCIASYLVREAGSDCVSRPLGTDMFSAVYNDTGRSYLHLFGQGSDPFTWNERTEGGFHKLYCNCAGFLALITKGRDYLSSVYKKAFDLWDCRAAGSGCRVFDEATAYETGDHVLRQGKVYRCVADAPGGAFDGTKWEERTVAEFSLQYMRYEETKSYQPGDHVLLGNSLFRCVSAVNGGPWNESGWELIRGDNGVPIVKDSVLLAYATEKGNIHEKPWTMDFKNLIYTYYMAFLQDHSGNPLKRVLLRREDGAGGYRPAEAANRTALEGLEEGDLLFFSRPQSTRYKGISHCGYYLKSLDRLNAIGAAEYGGVTFSAVDHGENADGEWGYVAECAGAFPEGSGRNTIRISTLKGMMNHSGTNNPYVACYCSKPNANPFNSTKAARLASFTATTDDRIWFGNRISNQFVTDPDGVPYGSYWLQPGDGKAHMHTVTAASLGAEGYLLARMLPHGLDYEDYPYEDYPDETLDINFIPNGVYRCDREELADRLRAENGASRLPAEMTQEEKVFLLVQTGGIEEEERSKARYGVQMILPSLAANGTVYLRSRNEGYYNELGSVSATGLWGGWKKIVTLDQMPAATAATAGLVKVGDGLKMTAGALGVDPNGRLSLLNLGVTGTKLALNADLNALGNGVWRCDTSDLAATVSHLPPLAATDLRAFTVLEYGSVVISPAETRYGAQIFMTNPSPANGTAEIFLRTRGYSGGWQSWQRAGETPSLSLSGTMVEKLLLPNVQYECRDPVTSLTLTFRAADAGTQPAYSIMFTAGENMTLSVPDYPLRWAVTAPVWAAGSDYLVTFVPQGQGYLGLWSVAA